MGPGRVAAGLKRMAMVTAEAGLSKVIIEEGVKELDNHGLAMRKFDSVAAATVWAQSGLSPFGAEPPQIRDQQVERVLIARGRATPRAGAA